MEKVCAFTCVEDRLFDTKGTPKLVSSLKSFHPEIDFFVFGDKIVNDIFEKNQSLNWYNSKPTFAKLLTDKYDLIIHFDADCFVLAPLTEMLTTDYEIGATLNHNWFQPASILSVSNHMYVGASTFSARSKKFLDDWEYANKYAMSSPDWPNSGWIETPWREQGVLNILFYYLNYKKKAFGVLGNNTDKEAGRGFFGSQSLDRWRDFVLENGKILLDDKPVITLHEGGGYGRSGHPDSPRLDFRNICKPEVADYMESLCKNKFNIDSTGKVTML